MKTFVIDTIPCEYDQIDRLVVYANNRKEAIELAQQELDTRNSYPDLDYLPKQHVKSAKLIEGSARVVLCDTK